MAEKKRSQRLQLVTDLAEKRKQEAERFLGEQLKRVELDKTQLQQLEQYLSEYQNQYLTALRSGMNGAEIANYQAFMNKIADTIEQHKKTMKVNQEQLTRVKQFWSQTYGRHRALEGLTEKARDQEAVDVEKALQKSLDERSQRLSSSEPD
jgi:flagellar FliJ protein